MKKLNVLLTAGVFGSVLGGMVLGYSLKTPTAFKDGNITLNKGSLVSVYDGDSFKVDLDNLPTVFGEKIGVRVGGIDTPEMRGKCPYEKVLANKAKHFTEEKLRNADVIELRNISRGKYFRIVADVYTDGESLTDGIVEEGLGYRYYGGTKIPWCKPDNKSLNELLTK